MAFRARPLAWTIACAFYLVSHAASAGEGYFLCRVHSSNSDKTYKSELFRTTRTRSDLVSRFLLHVQTTYERDAYDAACLGPLVTPEYEGGDAIATHAFVRQHQGRDIVDTFWTPPGKPGR